MCMRCSWISPSPVPLDAASAARCGAHRRHPSSAIWWPGSAPSSTSRCRSSRPIRWCRGGTSSLSAGDVDVDEQVQRLCAAERAAVCDLADQPAFRAALIRTAARSAPVRADQSPHRDGWLVAADPAAARSLPAITGSGCPRPRRIAGLSAGWPSGTWMPPARPGREVLAGFDTPTLVGPPDRLGLGPRGVASHRVSEQTTHALSELARSHHTTVSTVLQAAWAQLLSSLTGQQDVVFGTAVSGRPAEVAGAESMVGLLINTVPVRATPHRGDHHRRTARTAAERPQPHPGASASGAAGDPPPHRSRPVVRHPVRLRELPDRHRRVVGRARVGHHRVHHPRIQPLPA